MSNCSWFFLWELQQSHFGSCYLIWCYWVCRWVKHPKTFLLKCSCSSCFNTWIIISLPWELQPFAQLQWTKAWFTHRSRMKHKCFHEIPVPQNHTSDYSYFLTAFYVVKALYGYPAITPHTATAVVRESWFNRIWPYLKGKEIDRGSTKMYGIKVAEPKLHFRSSSILI